MTICGPRYDGCRLVYVTGKQCQAAQAADCSYPKHHLCFPRIQNTCPLHLGSFTCYFHADASAGTDSPSTQEVLDTLALDPYYSSMLQAVYVDMAYVALAMNNPSIALHEAKQLLGMQNCSKENKCATYPSIASQLLDS